MVDMDSRFEPEYLLHVIARANYIEVCIESEDYLMSLSGDLTIRHSDGCTPF